MRHRISVAVFNFENFLQSKKFSIVYCRFSLHCETTFPVFPKIEIFGNTGNFMNIKLYGGFYKKSENDEFRISIPEGTFEWVLLHFYSPMVITLGERRIETQANACILYRPGTPQDYYGRFGKFENDYIRFRTPSWDRNFYKDFNLPVDEVFYVRDSDIIKTEMQNITWLLTDKSANHDYELTSNAIKCLKKLQAARIFPDQKTQRESEQLFRLEQLRDEIRHNPEKWTVHAMSENFFLTRSHFSVLYKKCFGVSPAQDLKFFLNEKAIALLLTSEKTIAQIAEILNYKECENFIRAFKKMNDISPLQFRKTRN